MIRLSGGSKKRSNIKIPKGVRPTRSVVRRSIFDRLGPRVEGTKFLELFAGTGAVGLEALSRGASEVVFVEKSSSVKRILMQNIKNLSFEERIRVLQMSVRKALEVLKERGELFDIVFADPPYKFLKLEENLIGLKEITSPEGYFILEVRKDRTPPNFPGFNLEKEVRFGDTKILWYSRLSREL